MSKKSEPVREAQAGASMNLWQTVQSVAASLFGVQSSRNRHRDFERGKPGHFVIVGVVMLGLFIGGLWLIVQLLLRNAGL